VVENTQRGVLCSVLLTKYYSGDQIKSNKMGEHVARMKDGRGAYRVLVWHLKEKRHLKELGLDGRNSKVKLQDIGREAWTEIASLRVGAVGRQL
jgi:hypothetical protein